MSNILIVYSTVDGHTRKICLRIKQLIERENHRVEVLPIDAAGSYELENCDKIIIGASIRYGKHNKLVYRFISQYQELLNSRPSAFFSVNLVARKPGKNTREKNPYVRKFLSQVSWEPRILAIFAGKVDYQIYGPLDRFVIRLIMRITKGPTDPHAKIEFTDWGQVESFAGQVSSM